MEHILMKLVATNTLPSTGVAVSPIARILLIEDDARLAVFVTNFLNSHGYQVMHCANVNELDFRFQVDQVDLIICDIMLPGTDGFTLIKEIRQHYFGLFIFMSALSDEQSQLRGFELGADDYLVKPIKPELLLARIKAKITRYRDLQVVEEHTEPQQLSLGQLNIDKDARTADIDGLSLKLSRHEFDVLWLLASNTNKPLTREYLYINIIGREYDGLDRTIDGRISRLRKKVNSFENSGCKIRTMWGQGYMLSSSN